MIFPYLLLKLHAWHFLIFECLVVDMTPLPWLSILLTIYKSPHMSQWGESRLQWPKHVVTKKIFKIIQLSTSTKPILKEFFINCIQNKIVQLPNNVIVKGIYFFCLY